MSKAPKKSATITEEEWGSETSVKSATQFLRHFYPSEAADIAAKALKETLPFMIGLKHATLKKPVVIPDEAVNVAAKIIYKEIGHGKFRDWEENEDRIRAIFREDGRLVLEAVARGLQP